ncbi:type I DNA topoisomerase [bacterium BFN5]|nr:type I DNA topoisomerase [bacterium BFN5]
MDQISQFQVLHKAVAQQEARDYIANKFGNEFMPEKPPVYSAKKSQDAHEAIRPTSVEFTPQSLTANLSRDQLRLYTLIWERFIASQMSPAIYDTRTVEINAGRYGLRATGSQLKFAGFMAVYIEGKDEEDNDKDVSLPDLKVGQVLKLVKVQPVQHFTEPPPRYTEASLVKTLEDKGIGRPSTYAPIIETILDRGYVIRFEKKFQPTELGIVVVDLLKEYFTSIVDVEFTAGMEDRLDEIADGKASRIELLRDFYQPFSKTLANAEEQIGQVELPIEISDVQCENCGKFMVIKQGRYGKFLACPGFPECRNTKPILKDTGISCPKCEGNIVERRTKRGKVFHGCQNYPSCDFVTWDIPLKDACPTCGSLQLRHNYKNGSFITYCNNEQCPTRENSPINKELKKKDKKLENDDVNKKGKVKRSKKIK